MQAIDFDACANDLESSGYALLPLPDNLTSIISHSFATARSALDSASARLEHKEEVTIPLIDPTSDSGSWTGYHTAASQNGRYNKFREGFVFSNGEMFDIVDNREFAPEMNRLYHTMHNVIANGTRRAIERRLHLPNMYFMNELGPTENSSQWHLKRYNIHDSFSDTEARDILPMHTDPSLISVVLIDQPGIHSGCMGLEVYDISSSTWKEIAHHGHGIAIIFVGSVLSHLAKGNIFPAAKHKVVQWWKDGPDNSYGYRVAATLFVRPHEKALMKPLPLSGAVMQDSDCPTKKYQTFSQWNERVARNYMKKKVQVQR